MPYEPRVSPQSPNRQEVEDKFVELLNGSIDREIANRWAMNWIAADKPDVDDDVVWWGLTLLGGIDTRGLDGVYLHPDEQVAEWLDTYRGICAGAPIPAQIL